MSASLHSDLLARFESLPAEKLSADGIIAAADLDFGTSGMAARGLRAQYIRRSGRTGRSAGRDDCANVTLLAAIPKSRYRQGLVSADTDVKKHSDLTVLDDAAKRLK